VHKKKEEKFHLRGKKGAKKEESPRELYPQPVTGGGKGMQEKRRRRSRRSRDGKGVSAIHNTSFCRGGGGDILIKTDWGKIAVSRRERGKLSF